MKDTILRASVLRAQTRLERGSAPQWRAFPRRTQVKVWCANDDTLRNALQLYHPYSMSARLAKQIASIMPRAVEGLLFRDCPDAIIAARLAAFTYTIRRKFSDDAVYVSFAAGTPGPLQKHTGQVTSAGRVIGYVKVTQHETVSELLQNEADMITYLGTIDFTAAGLPSVLAFERDHIQTLLVVSPPPALPARRRRHSADRKDARFLRALGSINSGTAALSEVFMQMRLDTDLEQTFAMNLPALQTVRQALQEIASVLGESGVRVSACHGDYAPWNTLELPDGTLFVIDWEYGRRTAPVLIDAFHRVFMPARLVSKERSGQAIDRLLSLPDDPLLHGVVALSRVSRAQLPAYVLLYLLGELARKPGLDEYLTDALRYALRVQWLGSDISRRR